jgi:hypothetical protein
LKKKKDNTKVMLLPNITNYPARNTPISSPEKEKSPRMMMTLSDIPQPKL